MKNIVIVGGGTAGWLSALYAQKSFPNDSITLVESKDIGILGAGEGSTPQIVSFLDYLNIPVSDLISNTKATIKNGIKFTNWSKDKNSYYHSFNVINPQISNDVINNSMGIYGFPDAPAPSFMSIVEDGDIGRSDLISNLSNEKKVPFSLNYNLYDSYNKILDFTRHANYSIHFDAKLLANYLSVVGAMRGIKTIDAKVESIISKDNGDIGSIVLDNGATVDTDFVLDCTGFARIFIGNHFKSEWISFKDILPMKKAMPFFIDIDKNNIPPYTESIAMEYGWMWKIPLQHRFGCGYVYDSDFISDEDARREIEKFLGFTPEYPRENPFDFNPGCYKNTWINNCLSVGLSSSFVEPLEATSIMQLIIELQHFFSNKQDIFNRNKKIIESFNKRYLKETLEVVDFIYLHYITDKTDNDFWTNFINKNTMSENLKNKIDAMNNSILENNSYDVFSNTSYYAVSDGLNLLDNNNVRKIYEEYNLNYFTETLSKQNIIKKQLLEHTISHSDFLKYLGGLDDQNS